MATVVKKTKKQKLDLLLKKHGKDKDAKYSGLFPVQMDEVVLQLHGVNKKQLQRAIEKK